MKKIIATAALSVSLALAACGSNSDADSEFAGENVEDVADEALADVPETAEPVAVETGEPTTAATEDRRKSLEQSADDAEAAANEIEAAIAAEFEQAEDARDAEVR